MTVPYPNGSDSKPHLEMRELLDQVDDCGRAVLGFEIDV